MTYALKHEMMFYILVLKIKEKRASHHRFFLFQQSSITLKSKQTEWKGCKQLCFLRLDVTHIRVGHSHKKWSPSLSGYIGDDSLIHIHYIQSQWPIQSEPKK